MDEPGKMIVENIFTSTFDSTMTISSAQCTRHFNDINSDFLVTMNSPVCMIKFIKLQMFTGNVIYNLPDSFVLDEQGFPLVTVMFPEGIWTSANVEAGLAALLTTNSPSGSTYTVVFTPLTAKLTITTSGPAFRFRMDFTSQSVDYSNHTLASLGFANTIPNEPLLPYNTSQTGINPINLSPYNNSPFYIHISSTDVTGNKGTYSGLYTYVVNSNNLSGQLTSYTAGTTYNQSGRAPTFDNMYQFRLRITDLYNKPIRFQHPVTIILSYTQDLLTPQGTMKPRPW